MFSSSYIPPHKANLLPLVWTYVYKTDDTIKELYVYNCSQIVKGTFTLGVDYATSLEQSGSILFLALSPLFNCTVYGVDATNAFAESSTTYGATTCCNM